MPKSARRIAILSACIGAVAVSADVADKWARSVRAFDEFDKFEAAYGRNYSPEERERRRLIFAKNFAFIEAENRKNHTYRLGVNKFADMSAEEFRATHLGLKRREKGARGWSGLPHLGTHSWDNHNGMELPTSVDWRSKGAVNPVKNQAQCGSCWAFATVAALEGAWEISNGELLSLSEQQLVDCSKANDGCDGGEVDLAFVFQEGHAVCTEESYPYDAEDGKCHKKCTTGIPSGGLVGYKDVRPYCALSLMHAVVQQPVAVAIEADQAAFQTYTSGVMSGSCGTVLDHAVTLVGYGEQDGTRYWLVRNSWGEDWGEEGYIKMLRSGPGKGECGIQMDASYPVVKANGPWDKIVQQLAA